MMGSKLSQFTTSFMSIVMLMLCSLGCPDPRRDFELIDIIGGASDEAISFDDPRGIVLRDGPGFQPIRIYIADYNNNRIISFAPFQKSVLTIFGESGNSPGQFNGPTNIAVTRVSQDDGADTSIQKYILVADSKNHRIQKFDINGNYILEWGQFGIGPGEFNTPISLDIDFEGNVYVVDSGNSRIQIFDSLGNYLNEIGHLGSNSGEFNSPMDIAIAFTKSSRFTIIDFIAVSDHGNNRIQLFGQSGDFLRSYDNIEDIMGIDIDYLNGYTKIIGVSSANNQLYYIYSNSVRTEDISQTHSPYDVSFFFVTDTSSDLIYIYLP